MMKILEVDSGRDFRVVDADVPVPGQGEVLVKVMAVTTCPQWDLHLRSGEPMYVGHRFHYPYTLGQPGHEASGIVEAVGAGVTTASVGDHVSIWRDPGHSQPGCYAQYVLRAQSDVIRVPSWLPFEAAAPVELAMCLGTTFLRLKEMDVLRGRRVAIMGLGPAGLIAGQIARAEGATKVVGFDLSPARRAVALRNGFDEAYTLEDCPAEYGQRGPTMGAPWTPGLECAIDCVGAKTTVEWAMDHVSETVALFGVQREAYEFHPRHWLSLAIVGYPPHRREAAEYAVGLIERRQLDLTPLVTHHLPLDRYAEAIDLLERQEAIKVCFWPWGVPA